MTSVTLPPNMSDRDFGHSWFPLLRVRLAGGISEARAVDEPRYSVRVADHEYWREQIKCQYACPVHTDARGYVRAIAAGDYEHAYLIARGPNPLASLCGRICGAPCEAACRRGTIDQPISIRALKRFVCEKFGSDARNDAGRELFPYLKSQNQTRQCDDVEELSHLIEFLANAEFPKPTGERIAIIGSGPAGLAPADTVEILEGQEEGVARYNSWGPKEILVEERNGQKFVRGVKFVRCTRVYDENKRFAPKFDDGAIKDIEGDTVLLSVGQSADLSFIDPQRDGIEMRSPQQIVNDPATCATSAPGIFIAGDIAYGPRLMIHAIASGKQAARSVYRFLRGKEITSEEVQFHYPIDHYHREKHYERRSRLHIPTRSAEERLKSPNALVEIGYNEKQACTEAGRCLDCGINTIFDGERCILCGGCVDVCPTVCLKLVSFDRLALSLELETATRELHLNPADLSAIIKDEERCIRCGLCAQRCPTTAITMEQFNFAKEWKPCPV